MTLSPDEAKTAARFIAFETYHFRRFVQVYQSTEFKTGLCRQSFEYSLLLHLRILLDFFYTPPQNDDVGVNHFRVLPEFDAAFSSLKVPQWKKDVKAQLNKRLVHFTATRWTGTPDYEMADYAHHFDHIERLIVAFEKALPHDVREIFDQRTEEYKDRDRNFS